MTREGGDRSLRADERGQSIWWVMVWFVGVLVTLWVFVMVFGVVIEPIAQIVKDSAVTGGQDEQTVDILLQTMSVGGLLLGVGALVLVIVFAVWRERFLGQRRRMP